MAKRKTPKQGAAHSDYGPPEARQESHGPVLVDFVAEDGLENRHRIRRNLTPPLEYYRGQKIITGAQFIAGSALRTLYARANAEPRQISDYAERIAQGSVQAAVERKRRIVQAYNAALWWIGPAYAREVRIACCEESYLPSKVDRVKLKHGLGKLIVWFERGSRGRPIDKSRGRIV